MNGFLIYDKDGLIRNSWFVDELIRVARQNDVNLKLIILDEYKDFNFPSNPDFVIIRTINSELNKYFEECGVRVFNNYITSYYANNKWLTYLLAKRNGIPTMKTDMPTNGVESISINYPFVLKTLNGHGGTEVFKVSTQDEYINLATKYKNNCLIQEICSDVGKDVRVYCLGEEIVVAMLRSSTEDFRSNFSLGGVAKIFQPTAFMRKIVGALYKELKFDFVGVDFIYHNGEWVLNEIEDVVGTRMIYSCTSMDIANEYIKYIKKQLEK